MDGLILVLPNFRDKNVVQQSAMFLGYKAGKDQVLQEELSLIF